MTEAPLNQPLDEAIDQEEENSELVRDPSTPEDALIEGEDPVEGGTGEIQPDTD
jgi:hypothetical protein